MDAQQYHGKLKSAKQRYCCNLTRAKELVKVRFYTGSHETVSLWYAFPSRYMCSCKAGKWHVKLRLSLVKSLYRLLSSGWNRDSSRNAEISFKNGSTFTKLSKLCKILEVKVSSDSYHWQYQMVDELIIAVCVVCCQGKADISSKALFLDFRI